MTHELAPLRGIPSLEWGPGQQRRLDMVIEHLGLTEKRSRGQALVNGCGTGSYLEKLAPYYENIWGIDIEPSYLKEALLRCATSKLSLSACEQLPLPDKSMDMVFSHEVLEHVQDDQRAVAEMARVVKPGGFIVIFVPNRWFPFETHGFFLDGQYCWGNVPLLNYLPSIWRDRFAPHVRIYDIPRIWNLYKDLPLKTVLWTQLWPGFDALARSSSSAGLLLNALRFLMENTAMRVFGISHFLILQRLDGI